MVTILWVKMRCANNGRTYTIPMAKLHLCAFTVNAKKFTSPQLKKKQSLPQSEKLRKIKITPNFEMPRFFKSKIFQYFATKRIGFLF